MKKLALLLMLSCGGLEPAAEEYAPGETYDLCDEPPPLDHWCPQELWEWGGLAVCVGVVGCDFYAPWCSEDESVCHEVRITCVPSCP